MGKNKRDYRGYDTDLILELLKFNLDEIRTLLKFRGDKYTEAIEDTLEECEMMTKQLEVNTAVQPLD